MNKADWILVILFIILLSISFVEAKASRVAMTIWDLWVCSFVFLLLNKGV